MKVNEGKKKDFFMKPVGISRKTHKIGGIAPMWLNLATHHSITPPLHHSTTPPLHHSTTPPLHHSTTPSLHHSITPSLQSPPSGSSPIKPNRAIFMKPSTGKTPRSTSQHFRISAFQRLPLEIALANGAGELKLAGL